MIYVKINPKFFSPAETEVFIGNADTAGKILEGKPQGKFGDLVKIILNAYFRAEGLDVPGNSDAMIARKFPNI